MNNVLAVGGCAPTLTSNTHIPAPGLPTKPPSPTAVAINLLNLLKIVNTMSHPMYNPFAPGKQMPSQGPYGLSGGQMEMDPRRPPPHFGSGSNFSSSGSSGLTRGSSGGPIPSIMSLPGNYRPERNKITVDEDIDRCLDLNISRAREEVIQISSSQNTQFTNVQRDTFSSSNKGMPSYLTSNATLVNRSFTVDSSNNSLDWLPICQRGSEEESSKKYSSVSSSFPGSGASVFSTSSEGKRMSSIPGLGDYDIKRPAKSVPPPEPIRPKYTSESASNILLHFGLEKEDLEHLISYPEDQITPDNLPFILRQIKLEKEKKAATAVQSKPYCATQPIRSMGEKDKFIPSIRAGFNSDQISSTVLKPSKVIEYGHTGKYTTGVGNEVGRAVDSSAVAGVSGSLLCTDTFKPSSHVRDALQRDQGDLKTGPVVSSHSQMSSVSTVDSLRSPVAQSSSDLSKKLGVQTSQASTSLFPSFGLLNKDTELRLRKPEGPQIPPPKQPEPARQASTQPQPFNPPCNLSRGVHPGRPGLVLIHSNDSHNKSKTQGQGLKAPEQVNKIPAQQQPIQQNLQHQGPPPQKPQFQMHPQPIPLLKQVQGLPATMPPRLSLFPVRPALPTPAQVPIRPSLPMSAPMLLRPSLPTPAPGRMDAMPHMPPPVFKDQTSAPKMGPSKLPTPAMMQDYAAATPKIFPHTCCLCMKECTNMKDWLSHQNTSLHLDSCRLLRLRYPDWDGTTLELLSGPGKGTQASPTALDQSFHETRSHSLSPHRQHGSEDSKESPHHYYGSESRRQKRSSRSRSRSPQCRHSSDGQRERRSSRSPHTSRYSRRSRSRSYDRPTSSHHRSRSRSYERRSPPRKREAKRSSPRRSYERRPSPRRSDDRHSSPRRSREAWSPATRSAPQRKRSRSADRLAKRLLETTAVQSLSKQSNLEAMVKTLAPALLAELAKMKSSSNTEKKTSSPKSSKATSSRPKSGKSSSAKPMSAESLPAGKVRLSSVSASLSHDDIFDALEQFGKVKEVIIARASLQAVVQFEKAADAEKLKKLQCLQVKGLTVYVDKKMNIVSKKPQSAQKSAPQKKPAESSTTFTGKDKTPALPGAKTITTGKVATKAKGVLTKQAAVKKSTTAGKSAVKPVLVKTTGDSGIHKTKSPVKTSNADDSKDETTNTKPENYEIKSAETPSDTAEVMKMLDTTVGDEHKEEKMASQVKEVTPEAETSSNPVKAETQPDTLGVKDLESKSAPTENQPVAAKTESEELPLVTKTVDIVETSEENQVEECLKVDSIRIKVEDVEPGKTEPEEPMEILSSAESKDQLSETVKPAARVKTPPCSSFPHKTSADPPQTQQTTVKTEEMLVRDSLQVQPCPMEEPEPPAENVKTETEQLQSPKQKEQCATDVSSHLTPELVSDVVAVKLEEPTSAGKKSADGTAAPADVFSLTATVKTEKQEQQKETKRTPQKTVKSSMPLSKDSHDEKQPPPQTCASVSPTPAEPIQSGSVKADMKAGKNETEVVAIPTVSHKSNENSERKQSPRAPVVPADKQTTPVPYTSTTSVTALGKPQDDDAELPQIDEEFFRALTTALREHRLRQGEKKTSEESSTISKTTSEGLKEEFTPLTQDETKEEDNYSDPFDEFDFNFGDFVTVDEISEEMDDALVETEVENTSVSLEPISRATTEKLSPDVSSAASKTSTRSSKTCKSSTSSSSKSEKGSDSLSSEPENKQKPSSEPPKFETKSSSVSAVKPKSSSTSPNSSNTPLSSQSNKSKPLVRSLETSSSGRSTRSAAAANKSPLGTQQVGKKDVKPTESAVAKSDHHVSAESCSANTVESELRMKTSKIQPTEGQSSQIQNLKTDFKNVKEMKKNEVKDKKKDMDGKTTEEKGGNNGNKLILDSFKEKSDEQENKDDNQDRRMEIQISGVEQDQLILQGANNNSPSDGCQEKEVDESTKLQDCALKNQAATAHDEETNQTPNSSSVKQNDIRLSERVGESSRDFGQNSNEEDQNDSRQVDTLKDQKLVVPTDLLSKADDEEAYEVIDSLDGEPATTEAEREKKEQKKKESTTTCRGDRPTRKGRSRSQTFKSEEKENSLKQQDKTRTYVIQTKDGKIEKEEESLEDFEEMVYEVVDSIEDDSVQEPSTTGSSSRRQTPRGNKNDEKTSPPVEEPKISDDEEEEVFTVLDSVEEESPSDKPVVRRSTRGRRQNIAKKVEENTKTKQDKTPTRRRCTPVRDSKEKDGEKTPKIDVPLKKSTLTKSDSAVPSTGDEDTVCMELDAIEYDQPTTQKPKRGRPKDNKTSQKQSEEEEEPVYQIVDSLEEDQENTMTVTSSQKSETKVEMTADVNIVSLTKVKEDTSPTRRHTPARDAQEKDRVQLKESAQTKSDTAVASTGEVDDTCKQLIVVKEGQPTTQKSRRGRPKKDNKTSKKQTEEEEEPVYQIVDSLEEDQENTMTIESSLHEDSEPNIEMTADFNTVLFTKSGEVRTLTRRQCTPTRDSHEKDVVSLKESTPTQTSNAAVVNTGEEDTTIEELDAVENSQPATQKPGRGRPKKKNKTSKKLTEEEETVYQNVDSLEGDQDKTMMVAPIHMEETEAKVEMTENVNTVLFSEMKEDKILTRGQCTPARDSKEKDRVPLKEGTPTKKSNAAVTSTGDEDSTYEEFNAPEDGQPTTQKPRRGRPKKNNKTSKKQTEEDEEPAYQIVDSLEDQEKNVRVEASLQKDSETKVEMTANANIDLFTKAKEDKKLTKRRHTPARDSQENDGEKTPKPDVCVPLMESTPRKENDARHLGEEETTYEVLDAFEEEVVAQATRASRRERPKKDNKTSEKPTENLKIDSPRKDEEATYQILDSVEDEVVDDVAPVDQSECAKMSSTFEDDDITKEMIRSLLNKEEGGTIYQIVDSLEEDQVQEEMMTETAMQEESETTGDMVPSTDHTLSSPSTVEPSEQTGGEKEIQLTGETLENKEDPSVKASDAEGKESTLEADIVEKDESSNEPNNHLGASEENMPTSPKSKDTEATENILVNLDQVSEDEEDFPDDTAEEEELKKRQAAAKKRENDREDKRSREREAMERRSRSSSKGRSRKSTWEPEKMSQEDLEKVEVDAQDLVTLDEVGGDEVGEEAVTEAPTWKVELTEGELQDLVTLDEIVEEEEGQLEAPPESLESQFMDSLKSETLTETSQTEDNKDDDNHPKEPSSSSKHKLDDITEENGNFVTVDEVGEIEEEEEKEAVKRTGRPKKRCRLTPVRKSTRGKTVKEENKSLSPASLDSSSTLDTSGPSGDVQSETQRKEEGKNAEAASTEHQPQPNDGLKLGFEEAEKQEHRRAGVKVVDKRKQEATGPEAKRSRSQSPSVSVNLQLPPFNPKNPLGKEFVNPTSGFFCSLCSVFYLNEDTAKEIHCSSREHYDNLKNYCQRLQQNVQGSLSD